MKSNIQVLICRPYISLPNESAGVDRYISLLNKILSKNISSKLLATDFKHNQKKYRNETNDVNKHIILSKCGGYTKNLSLARIWFEMKFAFAALKNAYIYRPKIIVVGEPLFFIGFLLCLYKITNKCVLIGDFIDLMPEAYLIKFKYKFNFYLFFSPLLISRWIRLNFVYSKVVSVSDVYFSRSLINKKKINVFYWGCYDGVCVKEKHPDHGVMLYAGSLGEGYDIETLIEYGKINPRIKIVIAGAGPKENLCRKAHELGYIEFYGNLSREKLDELYSKATIGILPYKINSAVSMPIKYFEYIKNGLFIINSTTMECSRIIQENKIGANYLPGNVDSFADAVNVSGRIIFDSSRYNSLLKNYNVDIIYDSYANFLKDIIFD
jgi:glycosyltransferase involved in cell wall biosynthesis